MTPDLGTRTSGTNPDAADGTKPDADGTNPDAAGGTSPDEAELPIDGDGLTGLRSAVAIRAGELGAEDVRDDLVLVAQELASNVVRHGGGTGRLRLWREGRRLLCRVTDSGPGLHDTAAGDVAPPPRKPGGRGLWIARKLAEVLIESGPTGTTVTAALSF